VEDGDGQREDDPTSALMSPMAFECPCARLSLHLCLFFPLLPDAPPPLSLSPQVRVRLSSLRRLGGRQPHRAGGVPAVLLLPTQGPARTAVLPAVAAFDGAGVRLTPSPCPPAASASLPSRNRARPRPSHPPRPQLPQETFLLLLVIQASAPSSKIRVFLGVVAPSTSGSPQPGALAPPGVPGAVGGWTTSVCHADAGERRGCAAQSRFVL